MKTRCKMVDFSFRRNEQHVLSGILEYALILAVTMIAIIAASSWLNEQLFMML